MSMAKRGLASSSSGQPSQPKRLCLPPTGQVRHWSERNLMPSSWLTEEDARRVFREEAECIISHWADSFQSCMGNAFEEMMQQISSMKNAVQELMETVELANIHPPHLGRANAESAGKNDVRNLRLQLQTKLSDPLYTGKKLEGEGGAPISVALIDANTGVVVTSGLESSIKLEVVVLEGDFNKDDEDDWAQEEFENYVVKERERKGPLLIGHLLVTLKGGIGALGDLIFTDNSSWNRSKRFRIGLKVASGYCGHTRIREAKTDAFRVKEHRGESSKKHDSPAFDDEVWRLKKIAKDGKYHQKLNSAGIRKVGDFLLQLFADPMKLKEILGKSIIPKNWDILVDHAKTCMIDQKLYLYYSDGMRNHGAVFNTDGQLIGLIKDRVSFATHRLSAQEKECGYTIVKEAWNNLKDVREFNGETFYGSMQKKSLSSFPSQVFERQSENSTPVQHYLAPPILPPPAGPEAPPTNAGFTAEVLSPGHNGVTVLPVQSQHPILGNPMEVSVDKSVQLTAHQHIPADRWSVLISPGNDGITRLPIQSHDIISQFAMHSQMIDSSSHMDYAVTENVLLSEPTCASISSFQSSCTLPHNPEGNHVMEDFQSIDSDDTLGNWWDDNPPYDDMFLKTPLYDDGPVRGTSKGVNGWLKIKAVLQWGFFIRRGVRIVQLDEPLIEVQA